MEPDAGIIMVRPEKRYELQWLRALAASEVVVCHSDLITKHFSDFRIGSLNWYYPLSGMGVELFFVLSGYIICMRAPSMNSGPSFLLSRILRLYPMYWIFTSLVVVAYFLNPAWRLAGSELDASLLLKSYLILPQERFPILPVGWTLEHEMLFYTTVSIMMLLWGLKGYRPLAVAFVLGVMGFIGCTLGTGPLPSIWAFNIFSPYMFAFGLGWLLKCSEDLEWRARSASLLGFAAIVGAAVWLGDARADWLVYRIAVATMLFAAITAWRGIFVADNAVNRAVWHLGDASFSIYLSHWLVLSAIGKMLGAVHLPMAADAPVRIFFILVSLGIGYGFYIALEKPIDRWLRQRPASTWRDRPKLAIGHLQKLARQVQLRPQTKRGPS
jgi:peptidoglycan/LPS O-acetylase OafA/YrhL